MKVRSLIEALSHEDPDAKVVFWDATFLVTRPVNNISGNKDVDSPNEVVLSPVLPEVRTSGA